MTDPGPDPTPEREPHGPDAPRAVPDAPGAATRDGVAAGLILAAVALGFAFAPRIVAWADATLGIGSGFYVGMLLAVLLVGGFVGVFVLRGRMRRDG